MCYGGGIFDFMRTKCYICQTRLETLTQVGGHRRNAWVVIAEIRRQSAHSHPETRMPPLSCCP